MIDQLFDRNSRSARAELNRGLDRGFARIARAVLQVFESLHRIQHDAPWHGSRKIRRA